MNALATCKKCSRPIHAENGVLLWDGGHYCRVCVEQTSPLLLQYALTHESLQERMVYDWRAALRYSLRICAIVAIFFWALFSLAMEFTLGGVVVALVGAVIVTLVAAMIQVPGLLWWTKRAIPSVAVSEGNVTVARPNWKAVPAETHPLDRCQWYRGKSRQDSFLRSSIAPNGPAVILVFSVRKWGLLWFRHKIACGFSEEMREIWTAFLELAEVSQMRHRWKTSAG